MEYFESNENKHSSPGELAIDKLGSADLKYARESHFSVHPLLNFISDFQPDLKNKDLDESEEDKF